MPLQNHSMSTTKDQATRSITHRPGRVSSEPSRVYVQRSGRHRKCRYACYDLPNPLGSTAKGQDDATPDFGYRQAIQNHPRSTIKNQAAGKPADLFLPSHLRSTNKDQVRPLRRCWRLRFLPSEPIMVYNYNSSGRVSDGAPPRRLQNHIGLQIRITNLAVSGR